MGRTAVSTQIGFMGPIAMTPISGRDLPKIACPTLVITTQAERPGDGGGDQGVATTNREF